MGSGLPARHGNDGRSTVEAELGVGGADHHGISVIQQSAGHPHRAGDDGNLQAPLP